MTVAQCAVWMKERRRAVLVQSLILALFKIDPDKLELTDMGTRDDQDIGEACGGTLVGRCSQFYGDKLHVACWSCPGLN